ncbi:MAG: DUF4350 domain-containing protein [Thermoanaerobaculia bacterium]
MIRHRWLILVTTGALTLLLLVVLIWTRSPLREGFGPGSSMSRSPDGLSQAAAYLRRSGSQVGMLSQPIDPIWIEPDAVVLRILPAVNQLLQRDPAGGDEPVTAPGVILTAAENAWVARGGRLILGIAQDYGAVAVRGLSSPAPVIRSFPLWPSVHGVEPAPQGYLDGSGLARTHTILLSDGHPVLVRAPLGRGDVILFSLPEAFENQHLAKADNLALLVELTGGRPVYFDEFAHGVSAGNGIAELLTVWNLGPLLVLLVIAAILSAWRRGTRIGRPDDRTRDSRSEAVDMVDSLAILYDRALRHDEALVLYRRHLEHTISIRTGARGSELADRVARLTDGEQVTAGRSGPDMSSSRFHQLLALLNSAFRRIEDAKRR